MIDYIICFLRSRNILKDDQSIEQYTDHKLPGKCYIFGDSIFVLHADHNIMKRDCMIIIKWLSDRSYVHKFVICNTISNHSYNVLNTHNITQVKSDIISFLRNRNESVPVYTILDHNDVDRLCKKYACDIDKFPNILHTDPQITYLGISKGSVVYNLRDDIYRVVI